MTKFWRGVFGLAAVFNLIVGGAMLAAPERVAAGLSVSGAGAPFAILMTGLLIAVFGLGYTMVARDPVRNRGIVWMGMIGKFGVVVLATTQYATGVVPFNTFATSLGDLAFVVLFALFLWRGPR